MDNDVKLKDLGFNSIIFIQILVKIENEFVIRFEDQELDYNNTNYKTLSSLVVFVMEKLVLLKD